MSLTPRRSLRQRSHGAIGRGVVAGGARCPTVGGRHQWRGKEKFPIWASSGAASAAAALCDGAVDVLDRDIDAAEILVALGPVLAQSRHFARPHQFEEILAISRTGVAALAAQAFDVRQRLLQARRGGGEILPA